MYQIEEYTKEISVEEYIENYVDIEEFLTYCKACRNYNTSWACPSHDFDVEGYWRAYRTLYVVAKKICFEKGTDTEEGLAILRKVKEGMGEALYEMEAVYPQSKALSAGTCLLCGEGNCTRALSEPCRYPDKMRYSIESLGGNVGLTVSKLMGIQLEWIEEGKLPSYFVLVGGLLKK